VTEIYRDPSRAVEERVQDLLSRMTLEEKVGQMCQMNGQRDPERWVRDRGFGSLLHTLGEETQDLQRMAAESRLGIPVLFGIDAIHGHAFWHAATVFPTQLGLSCAWNPELVWEVGRITAREVSATGIRWTFSPVLGTARDLRWGRIDETFGEDPYLIGVLGGALIRGYQGDSLSEQTPGQRLGDPDAILACAKHYAGYPGTRGGRDASEGDITRRGMLSLYLQPFRDAAESGCATFMTAYHSIDGLPCTADRWLLWDVLKEQWGVDGFVVTDWNNVGRMHEEQKVCATLEAAVQRAAEAGNDMIMTTPEFYELAIQLVRAGKLDVAHIDEACRRILRKKFELGLFDENRYVELEAGAEAIGCAAHRKVALESAYQSIVLLRNEAGLLPLSDDVRRIAVIGPNADDPQAQLGDWVSWSGQLGKHVRARARESIVTVLDGIRDRGGSGCRVEYHRGCDVLDPEDADIAGAVQCAAGADVAILVVGDDLRLTGETRDRADLDLSGRQQELLEAVHGTGTPMVVVLINSKPLSIPWVAGHAHAVLEAWNPGLEGGTAVAGILFGDRNPSAKLTLSFPVHVGQLPVYYNQVPGWHGDQRYVDMPREPLYAFGYGLSYTTFAYSNLRLRSNELSPGEAVHVEVDVENTGTRVGTEIVQLYVNDVYSSVTTPIKELKAFQRIELAPGEVKTVSLEVPYERLALVNRELETVVEPGEFDVMVGSSSRDVDLLKATFVVGT
jgi:beta-glucosidase